MSEKVIRETDIQHFSEYLLREEKSSATYEKYCRDVRAFYFFTRGEPVTKEMYEDNLAKVGNAIKLDVR